MVICWLICGRIYVFFFFKQKTAYEMRISDWSSDVCSSDLHHRHQPKGRVTRFHDGRFSPGHAPGKINNEADRSSATNTRHLYKLATLKRARQSCKDPALIAHLTGEELRHTLRGGPLVRLRPGQRPAVSQRLWLAACDRRNPLGSHVGRRGESEGLLRRVADRPGAFAELLTPNPLTDRKSTRLNSSH